MVLRTRPLRRGPMKRFALHAVALLTLAACNEPTRPASPRPPNADVTVAPNPDYIITDLGTLGGTFSQGLHLNASGSVVGSSTTASGDEHAFVWTPQGGMKD